ncbi:hypothetical protein KIPB_008013 [Kipferlia bialata]|uniref:Uncharacterized protein n=1 Tax=Kipferlia bialata TaxID=797122 RepID=A0A391NNA9_9EUKA|nr:hypothetical protein KIPB_008013 [Kipferlia bialata]|eukprot:g8013.t1
MSGNDPPFSMDEAITLVPCTLPFALSTQRPFTHHSLEYLVDCGFGCVYVQLEDDTYLGTATRIYEAHDLVNGISTSVSCLQSDGDLLSVFPSVATQYSPASSHGLVVRYGVEYEEGECRKVVIYDIADPSATPRLSQKHATQYIGGDGMLVRLPDGYALRCPHDEPLEDPVTCALDGYFVFVPDGSFANPDSGGAWIYDQDTDVFIEDSRACPDFDSSHVPVVVDDTLHVFSQPSTWRKHWVYSFRHGWREEEPLPRTLSRISCAQSYGRLIVLTCVDGFHLYDTISGDWSRVGDLLDSHGLFERNLFSVRVSPNQMLCVEDHRVLHANNRDHGVLHPRLLTLNPGLLYPSVDMGWGRLLESDLDWRVTLGIDRD